MAEEQSKTKTLGEETEMDILGEKAASLSDGKLEAREKRKNSRK